MADFYHVFIQAKEGVTRDKVEEKMNLAIDWFRYTRNVWVLYTTSNEDKWQARLKPLVEPGGSLFICRLDISCRNGWMTPDFWRWIKDKTKRARQRC